MAALTILRVGLVAWVVWHAVFGLLSTFAPELGGDIVGWTPVGGWDAELVAMSKQYGMVMLLLAAVYLLMLIDPPRYIDFIWVAVAEQALGIAYGAYIYATIGQLSMTQLGVQVVTNLVLIAGMIVSWSRLRQRATPVAA